MSAQFYLTKIISIHKKERDLLSKVREHLVGGPSKVFAVVDKTHIRKSTIICQTFVGIDASQFNIYSMCQPMPTLLYTKRVLDAYLQ